jgi:hypothetical protein
MKKIISSVLIISLLAFLSFLNFEPEMTKAVTATDEIVVSQQVTSEITISAPADITMSPAIPGMTGGVGNGSAQWTVKTNDTSGYSLSLRASTSPALISGSYSFADYTPATSGVPDFNWSVAASASEFGYTVEASTTADLAQLFKDNGTNCNTGTQDTVDKCWLNASTTNVVIVNRSSETTANGENTTVKFRAEVGATSFQEEGNYTATIIMTASTN